MVSYFEQIKNLFDEELYSNVISVTNLILSINDRTEIFTPLEKFQVYVYFGDSLFHLSQLRKAESIYRRALQFKKSYMKSKSNTKATAGDGQKELMPDIDIKYQIHLCHVGLKQSHQAITVLQSIPGKQRNAKINMALARLYQQGGMERSAITSYKEVLRECPFALDAADGLLSLGVKGIEVNSLVIEASNGTPIEWLNTWIKGHAQMYSREYPQAVQTLKILEDRSPLQNNIGVLLSIAECHYFAGEAADAIHFLQRVRAQDYQTEKGLDILSALLYRERRFTELEKLHIDFPSPEEYTTNHWIAWGYIYYSQKKPVKALYHGQKASKVSPRSVEALVLKASILFDLGKYQEAIVHYREAMQIGPFRYEPHKGLIDCYLAVNRARDAITLASNSCKQLGHTPRALTLYGSVLMKDPVTVCKAKSVLEKALSQDENYLPAVYLLAELYEQQEMSLGSAIALLEKQLDIQPTCKLHMMIADLLEKVNEEAKAVEHYSLAYNLDPNNSRAIQALHRLDSSPSKLDSTYYIPSGSQEEEPAEEKMADSDNEVDPAQISDTEAMWSDMDLELNSQ